MAGTRNPPGVAPLLRSPGNATVPAAGRIEASRVGRSYGALQVFRDVTFDVAQREVVALIGPSGCGKTTLLRCIAGLLPLSEGSISISGDIVTGPPEGVAMVFQRFGLFPWRTVFQNVAYGLQLAKRPRGEIKKSVSSYINLVGLAGFENHYPYQISGGMQQRCGLARALAVEPSVLLMDEPFGAVDAQTREILQFELLHIWGMRPMTLVFVTHSIEEAVLLSDRVIVLKRLAGTSRIREIVAVDLARPRSRNTLANPQFTKLREHLWQLLMTDTSSAEVNVLRPRV